MAGVGDEERAGFAGKAGAARTEKAPRPGLDRRGEAIRALMAAEHHVRPVGGEHGVGGRARLYADAPRTRIAGGRVPQGNSHRASLTSTRLPITRTACGCNCTSGAVRHSPVLRS